MTEADAIDRVDEPATVSSLAVELRDLGVAPGDTLLVHSSLSAIGYVAGGAPAVVDALMAVLTERGTLVMPTHTTQYTDPEYWENPPVPDDWVETIRETRPAYRLEVTPTRGMGAIAECFRSYPDVLRSEHPIYSFAAWGADADEIVGDHGFDRGLGENSPLARVYDHDGDVLLLGVDHDRNTSLHLAEYRTNLEVEKVVSEAPVLEDGQRTAVQIEDIETDSDDFAELGADFENDVGITEGAVGAATAKLIAQRAIVDYAVDWFETNR